MTSEGDEEGDVPRMARKEARATLDHQLTMLDDMDRKAIRILQLDATLAGVLVTAISLVAGTSIDIGAFVNMYVGMSVASLVFSAVAAALTYTLGPDSINIFLSA